MREIAFGIVMALVVATVSLAVAAWPLPGRPVMAVFAPGSTAAEIVTAVSRAGGHTLSLGSDSPVAISIADAPGHPAALYRAGAWLVADASLARICLRLTDLGRSPE